MVNYPYRNEGLAVLRIVLGLFFIITGLMKIFNPSSITGLLSSIGFPASAFWGWAVIIAEILFGLLVLVGWRPEISVWPLVVILAVAIFKVFIPQMSTNPLAIIIILFHIATIAGFVTLALTGPGSFVIARKVKVK